MAIKDEHETNPRREVRLIANFAWPIILAHILQYSIQLVSVLSVGRLGNVELGAISLGTTTASITAYTVYQGLATSLDTLCAQAYGSGHKELVGLHCQRMIYLLWSITVPIGFLWGFSDQILGAIIPNHETVALTALYLRVVLVGAPGWAAFESMKRFMQAQGLFTPILYVLLILAPFNVFLHWLFVWKLAWGFVGAPLAAAITNDLLPVCLAVYVRFVDGKQCWHRLTYAALHDWMPMVKLAIPGLLMIEGRWIAFQILTLSATYLDSNHFAAQSVVMTMTMLGSQIPLPLAIAASTRIGNLIGAGSSSSAKMSAKMAMVLSILMALLNAIFFASLKRFIPFWFTSDVQVAHIVTRTLSVISFYQIFDGIAIMCNGILRGIGRQNFGGYVTLICYEFVNIFLSMAAFVLS